MNEPFETIHGLCSTSLLPCLLQYNVIPLGVLASFLNIIDHLPATDVIDTLVYPVRNETMVWVIISLQWRHNGRNGVSNHQSHDYLLKRLFRRRSKKHQSSASLTIVRGSHRSPVNSPHRWPVTRKMFPFVDVIMHYYRATWSVTTGCW